MGTKGNSVQDYIWRAEKWVDSRDRNALSDFAVDHNFLVLVHAHHSATIDQLRSTFINSSVLQLAKMVDAEIGNNVELFHTKQDAIFEYIFWTLMEPRDQKTMDYLQRLLLLDGADMRVQNLRLVYAYPQMYWYFKAELWDVEFIERCIIDDVDPQLAMEMLSHG